jgi:hypothetical protein
MAESQARKELAPPKAVIDIARYTMGGIDLDPYSNAEINHVVQAADYLERDHCMEIVTGRHWTPPLHGRLLLAVPSSKARGRAMANKALLGYRAGVIKQAILWFGANEVLSSCPWIWDFPVCIPFRRLPCTFWDDELEESVRVAPADWSAIVYLPTAAPSDVFHRSVARFHTSAAPIGRIVLDQWSGESNWLAYYEALTRKPYVFE